MNFPSCNSDMKFSSLDPMESQVIYQVYRFHCTHLDFNHFFVLNTLQTPLHKSQNQRFEALTKELEKERYLISRKINEVSVCYYLLFQS